MINRSTTTTKGHTMNITRKVGLGLAVGLSATLFGALPADATVIDGVRTNSRPCAQEDQVGCTWDAKALGNGIGDSFRRTWDGRVIPLTHEAAHKRITSWMHTRGYSPVGYDTKNDRVVFMNYNRTHRQYIALNDENKF